jgi:hypothetical protein
MFPSYDSENSLQMGLDQRLDFRSSSNAQKLHQVPKVQKLAKLEKMDQSTKANHRVCTEGENEFLWPPTHSSKSYHNGSTLRTPIYSRKNDQS